MSRLVSWGQVDGATDTSLSTIDGFLKEDYVLQNIVDTVNMAAFLLSKMNKEMTTAGRRFRFPLRFGVGEGQGNRGERETLPEAGFGRYDEAFGNTVSQYGNLDISGQAIAATNGGRATFASALKQAIKDCRDGFRLERYRQSWGDGTGIIALCDGSANSTTVAVTRPFGLTYSEADLTPDQKVRAFRKGMKVLFKTAAVARTISNVSQTAGTITVDSAVNYTDGEEIIRGDTTALSNEDKEYLGVSAVMKTTGTYLGVDRSLEPNFQANILDLAGEDLTEDALQAAFDTAEINGDGMTRPDMLLSEHLARRIYIQLLQQYKRFVSPTVLKGGWSALDYNGVPWVVDKLAPPQRLYYLNSADFIWFVMKDIGWLNEDGTVLKWTGKDSWQAVLASYAQIACKQPANQTMLTGIVPSSESV
jgi:hypothetical protein